MLRRRPFQADAVADMDATTRDAQQADAFRVLFDRTQDHVLAYCRRRTSTPADASDAAAETYLVAWRRFTEVPAGDEALPWLFATARRVLSNQRRSHRRWRRLHQRVRTGDVDLGGEPADAVIVHEEHRDALAALARLPEDDQELLRLTTLEGVSIVQAAMIMGCSRNAMDQRLHRARQRLAAEYELVQSTRAGTSRPGR